MTILKLTDMEMRAVSDAVQPMQQDYEDSEGRLDPVLSRVQRKLGEEPHS